MADSVVDVVVQIAGEDVPAGRLWSHRRRGAESATFAYFDEYLTRRDAYELDPSLPLSAGQHQTPADHALMLESSDREQGSYLDIASAIEEQSPHATRDLEQLWRRIAFSVSISNTDDHLRNHGFLRLSEAGWSLSPAFDLNPNPQPGGAELSTAIDWDDPTASIDLALDVAPYFRLTTERARELLGEVRASTDRWRTAARRIGVPRNEIDAMAPAFDRAARHTPPS